MPPKTAGYAQPHKSMSFIWIVWSTLYVYLWVLGSFCVISAISMSLAVNSTGSDIIVSSALAFVGDVLTIEVGSSYPWGCPLQMWKLEWEFLVFLRMPWPCFPTCLHRIGPYHPVGDLIPEFGHLRFAGSLHPDGLYICQCPGGLRMEVVIPFICFFRYCRSICDHVLKSRSQL